MYSSDSITRYNEEKSISIQARILENNKECLYISDKLLYIIEGKAKMKINNREYSIEKATIVIISPYSIVEIFDIEKPLNYIILSYNKLHLKNILNNINNTDMKIFDIVNKYDISKLNYEYANKVKKIMLEIREEIGDESILELDIDKDKDKLTTLKVVIKIVELLIEITRNLNSKKQKTSLSLSQTIIKYIYAHSSEKLSIMKLATIFFMSEAEVREHIDKFSSLTFKEILYKIRLQKTKELLLYTELNLDEIAETVGFVDGSHITKIWKLKKNMTPAVYRQIYKTSLFNITKEDKNVAFEIIDYLINNYNKELDVQNISKLFGLNEIKLNKLLLLYVDKNFNSFLNYTRINRSCELLLNTNKSIIDICFLVGYNNIKTFNNNFKKYKNITPTEFKNSLV
ncbi:helix-turn-helix transcriptional regulator [Sneathia sanguinegens]|uniref:helix-turn-helix transcriptional regulator n=2 Tax=Sneathia sanguinegens TaxID=40543 RepID=UPI00082D4372|nr:AraC family transcriptional regulator [Sneathia sanguinegens]MDU7496857.1 AraC family transcriptional regulator [Sneathia sanguinegens]